MAERTGDRGPARGTVVTTGTFDGVHRGHLAVLEALRMAAAARGARSVVVTFEPHPLRIVKPEAAPRLLTPPAEKRALLEAAGVDEVLVLPFTRELASFPPRRFVEEILLGRLGMTHLVIGYDHGFGRGRSGDVDALRAIGAEHGFGVDVVPALELDGEPLSSTRVRRALEAGDVDFAAAALGRPYALAGTVVRGEGHGRTLGFPTANLEAEEPDQVVPLEGIYAVRGVVRGEVVDGVLHLGPRPTFPGYAPTIELHLFDFDDELYGERVEVRFCKRLREIRSYPTPEALVEAIRADCAAARRVLAAGDGACQKGAGLVT